jgi:ATP-binding cassette subfamily B protein
MSRTSVKRVIGQAARANAGLLAALGAVVICAMVLEAAPALLLRRAIDGVATGVAGSGIWLFAFLYLCGITGQRVALFGQVYLTTLIGQDILHRLRLSLIRHLGLLPMKYFDTVPVGDTISRLTSDVEAVNTLFTSGVVSLLADVLKIAGAVAAMASLSPRLTVLVIAVIPVALATTEFFRRNIRRAEGDIRASVGMINAHYQESLTGLRVIHAFGQQTASLARLRLGIDRFLAAINRSGLYTSYFGPLMDVLRGIASLSVVIAFARASGQTDGLTLGTLAALLQLITRLFTPLTALSDEFQVIQQALAGSERIDQLLLTPPEPRPDFRPLGQAHAGLVEVSGVTFGYHHSSPVLANVTIAVPGGQRVAIVGRTGAGKTSLLNLLAGTYAPWQGTVTIDGIDPRSVHPTDRRRLLGVVPQQPHTFEGSVEENITLGDASISKSQVEQVVSLVGLESTIAQLPRGLDTKIGPDGVRLSHGEEQLLSLARALVCRPAVLLLDEPTSGVDAETERRLFAAIAEESKKRTTITVSHRLSGVMTAERVLVLASGGVVQDGPPERLTHEEGWYAMMSALETLGWPSSAAPPAAGSARS